MTQGTPHAEAAASAIGRPSHSLVSATRDISPTPVGSVPFALDVPRCDHVADLWWLEEMEGLSRAAASRQV